MVLGKQIFLYYKELDAYVSILNVRLDEYKSLEDFANHICPGDKFIEKLKLLMSQNDLVEINRKLNGRVNEK